MVLVSDVAWVWVGVQVLSPASLAPGRKTDSLFAGRDEVAQDAVARPAVNLDSAEVPKGGVFETVRDDSRLADGIVETDGALPARNASGADIPPDIPVDEVVGVVEVVPHVQGALVIGFEYNIFDDVGGDEVVASLQPNGARRRVAEVVVGDYGMVSLKQNCGGIGVLSAPEVIDLVVQY